VNSQTCEQKFSLFLKYVPMVKHMLKNHFNFFFLWLIDALNENSLQKIINDKQNYKLNLK
jgi:hypothetical protein